MEVSRCSGREGKRWLPHSSPAASSDPEHNSLDGERSTEGRCGGSASGDMDMVSSDATVRWTPLDRESLDLCLRSESGLWKAKE